MSKHSIQLEPNNCYTTIIIVRGKNVKVHIPGPVIKKGDQEIDNYLQKQYERIDKKQRDQELFNAFKTKQNKTKKNQKKEKHQEESEKFQPSQKVKESKKEKQERKKKMKDRQEKYSKIEPSVTFQQALPENLEKNRKQFAINCPYDNVQFDMQRGYYIRDANGYVQYLQEKDGMYLTVADIKRKKVDLNMKEERTTIKNILKGRDGVKDDFISKFPVEQQKNVRMFVEWWCLNIKDIGEYMPKKVQVMPEQEYLDLCKQFGFVVQEGDRIDITQGAPIYSTLYSVVDFIEGTRPLKVVYGSKMTDDEWDAYVFLVLQAHLALKIPNVRKMWVQLRCVPTPPELAKLCCMYDHMYIKMENGLQRKVQFAPLLFEQYGNDYMLFSPFRGGNIKFKKPTFYDTQEAYVFNEPLITGLEGFKTIVPPYFLEWYAKYHSENMLYHIGFMFPAFLLFDKLDNRDKMVSPIEYETWNVNNNYFIAFYNNESLIEDVKQDNAIQEFYRGLVNIVGFPQKAVDGWFTNDKTYIKFRMVRTEQDSEGT